MCVIWICGTVAQISQGCLFSISRLSVKWDVSQSDSCGWVFLPACKVFLISSKFLRAQLKLQAQILGKCSRSDKRWKKKECSDGCFLTSRHLKCLIFCANKILQEEYLFIVNKAAVHVLYKTLSIRFSIVHPIWSHKNINKKSRWTNTDTALHAFIPGHYYSSFAYSVFIKILLSHCPKQAAIAPLPWLSSYWLHL